MSSRCRDRVLRVVFFVVAATLPLSAATGPESRVLRVAADPNNLPFSNERGEGLENKLVELIARELGAKVEYTWWAQRPGFFRNTLKEGNCDLVAGVPFRFDPVLTTKPYYRSTYVLVTRADRALKFASLDDPALRDLTIGVQMVGDDFANTPPAHALARRGLIANVRGFTFYGDYREASPPAKIIAAVVSGEIDVAIVWGPLAGYFAKTAGAPLVLQPLPEEDSVSELAFAFDIAVGVRRSAKALRDEVDAILVRKKPEIDALLELRRAASHGVAMNAWSSDQKTAVGTPLRGVREVAEMGGDVSGDQARSDIGRRTSGRDVPTGVSPLRVAIVATSFLLLFAGCRRESRVFNGGIEIENAVASPALSRGYEENAYALSQGKRLFVMFNCAGCHGNGGGGMGPPLLDSPWRYGKELPQIFDSIMEGRPNGMPAFRGRIAPSQAWQLAAYVRSISGQLSRVTSPGRADHMKSSPLENSVDPVTPTAEPILRPKVP